MLNCTLDITKDAINEKMKNPFWRNFIIVWITWNWRVWYITFFVSEEKVWNKIDYIINMYNCFWYSFIWIILNWIIVPVLVSYLLVWWFPLLSNKFLKKHKENKNIENNILAEWIKSEIKVVEAKKKVVKAKKDLIIDENKLKKIEEKTESQKRDEDYEKLISKYKDSMKILSDFVYTKMWNVNNGDWHRQISTENENILDSFWLIEVNWSSHWWKVYQLTEKWKYFLKKSSLE